MSEPRQWQMATCLAICCCFSTMSWRIALNRQRREGSFVSILCTVMSKTCRPIGAQKTLGYCKSLNCVAGVLRGIEKSESGKGKPALGPPFPFLLHFPFTLFFSPSPSLVLYLPRRLLWNLYINFDMTVICLQYCKDRDRRTLVDLFYQDDQFMNSGNAFVQDSYSEKVSYKVAWMLSCLGGDLVASCFIILFLYWLNM